MGSLKLINLSGRAEPIDPASVRTVDPVGAPRSTATMFRINGRAVEYAGDVLPPVVGQSVIAIGRMDSDGVLEAVAIGTPGNGGQFGPSPWPTVLNGAMFAVGGSLLARFIWDTPIWWMVWFPMIFVAAGALTLLDAGQQVIARRMLGQAMARQSVTLH